MTATLLVQSAGTSAWIVQILPIVAIVGIFYFVVIGPANRQRRKTETMLSALKKGDRVLLTAGIYGTVQSVENDIVYLKIAENTKVKVAKSAIASVVNDSVAE